MVIPVLICQHCVMIHHGSGVDISSNWEDGALNLYYSDYNIWKGHACFSLPPGSDATDKS